jgi:lysophospholipase L1-like esterase
MKNILCFGDSNTWGYSPTSTERYCVDKCWGNILGRTLGKDYHIIEEGLNGRTIASQLPERNDLSGKECIVMLLESHRPLGLVIIMLGTNDLQHLCFGKAISLKVKALLMSNNNAAIYNT